MKSTEAQRRPAALLCARGPGALAGIAMTALTVTACAGEDQTEHLMRLALNQSEDHPSFIALENFGDRLEESTGNWGIDVYANATLGDQPEAMQLVSDGSVEMAIVSGAYLENLNEDFMVFNIPKVFDDVDHQMEVLHDPEITGELYSSLEQEHDFTVLGGFTQGSRSIFSTHGPVETPEDMAGLNLRVQESPLNIAMAEALGGAASPLATSELYTGLQSGVVDAAENNEPFYVTQALYEVAPYWSSTDHLVGVDYLVINTDVLESMDEEERQSFDEDWTATHQEHTELWAEATEEAIDEAEAGGATFNDVDEAAFDEALVPLADEFITTDSQRELYEAAREAAQ